MSTATNTPLYFDLESVPDYARLASFGLPDVPAPPIELAVSACPDRAKMLAGSVDALAAALAAIAAPDAYLNQLADDERAGKNRVGVHLAIGKARGARQAAIDAAAERCKLLSITPEYCRIAALGWAEGDGPVNSIVAAAADAELEILDKFWSLAAAGPRALIGYNVLHFDLPVIFVRTAIHDLPPLRTIDLRAWGNKDVLDLYVGRFGTKGNAGSANGRPGRLKQLAPLMGIDVPAGDMDGGSVDALLKTDPAKVGEYVRSDVSITRSYHKKLEGFFWQ